MSEMHSQNVTEANLITELEDSLVGAVPTTGGKPLECVKPEIDIFEKIANWQQLSQQELTQRAKFLFVQFFRFSMLGREGDNLFTALLRLSNSPEFCLDQFNEFVLQVHRFERY